MCETKDLVVLVVDHDEKELQKSCDSLNRMGITKLVCVHTYTEAIEALKTNIDVDIIIADYDIEPKKSLGALLCSNIRKENPGVLFILLSKEYSCSVIVESFKSNALDILDKNREGEIETLMQKWIDLAKLKNKTREILYGKSSSGK